MGSWKNNLSFFSYDAGVLPRIFPVQARRTHHKFSDFSSGGLSAFKSSILLKMDIVWRIFSFVVVLHKEKEE